jgi:hypothetical protein
MFVIGRHRLGVEDFVFMCLATGFTLGQGPFSIVALLLDVTLARPS